MRKAHCTVATVSWLLSLVQSWAAFLRVSWRTCTEPACCSCRVSKPCPSSAWAACSGLGRPHPPVAARNAEPAALGRAAARLRLPHTRAWLLACVARGLPASCGGLLPRLASSWLLC